MLVRLLYASRAVDTRPETIESILARVAEIVRDDTERALSDRALADIRLVLMGALALSTWWLVNVSPPADVARLQAAGLRATGAVIYDQRPCPLTDAARSLLDGQGPVLVPLFSPRTAALFAETAPHRAALWVAALSPAVASALGNLPVARLATASRPDAAAMLAAIAALIGGADA